MQRISPGSGGHGKKKTAHPLFANALLMLSDCRENDRDLGLQTSGSIRRSLLFPLGHRDDFCTREKTPPECRFNLKSHIGSRTVPA